MFVERGGSAIGRPGPEEGHGELCGAALDIPVTGHRSRHCGAEGRGGKANVPPQAVLSYKGFKGSCGVKEQQPHQEDCNDDPSINAHPPRVTRQLERSSLRAAIHRQFNWYDNVHNFSLPGPQCNAIIVLWPFKLLNGCYEN